MFYEFLFSCCVLQGLYSYWFLEVVFLEFTKMRKRDWIYAVVFGYPLGIFIGVVANG